LWLIDQEPLHGLQPLAEKLGLVLTPGTVVDPAAQQLNAAPTIPGSRVRASSGDTRLHLVTAFPYARAIGSSEGKGWQHSLIEVAPQGWVETGKLDETMATTRTATRRTGNHRIALNAAWRQEQRVIVVGNGGFLSNTYLATAATSTRSQPVQLVGRGRQPHHHPDQGRQDTSLT